MKTKLDEYVSTCKAYMDPQGLRLDLNKYGKVINLYNIYMRKKISTFFYVLTSSYNIIIVVFTCM